MSTTRTTPIPTVASAERSIQTTENITMNAHLAEAQAVRTSHPPQPPGPPQVAQSLQNRIARTSLPDRVAMWLGLKLLLWGTRPVDGQLTTSELHERRLERKRLMLQLELDRARAMSLFGQQIR